MIRIAVVHSFYSSGEPSGENSVVDAEVAALRRAGHEVALFAARTDSLGGERLYPIKSGWRVATGRGANPLAAVKGFGPDLVHVHNLFPNFGRRWVEDLEVPLIHTLHNFRPLCANGSLFRDGTVCTRCPDGDRWAGLRYGCYRGSRLATLPLAFANRHGPMSDPLLRKADRLIVLSPRQLAVYQDAGVPKDKLLLSPNFLPDELDPGPADGSSPSGWLYVGRLSEEKGVRRLLELWPASEKLTIVGAGPLRAEVEQLASERGATLLGKLDRSAVIRQMSGAEGLVFPSLWFEGFPMVHAEALAAGLPIVASGPNSVSEAVARDRTGVVVDLSPDHLQRGFDRVREGGIRTRKHCRRVFEEAYSEHGYLHRMTALHESLLANPEPSQRRSRTAASAAESAVEQHSCK